MAYNPTSITSLASGYVPFANAKPTKYLWVSPTGNNANTGADAAHALKTIDAAMAKAAPGTAVMANAGTYTDSIHMKSGTSDKPIWLVSADGEGKATIKAESANQPVIMGFGNDNMVIKGFNLVGGTEGVKFTQGGTGLVNLADNIVIQDNNIYDQRVDGIKVAQARNAVVVDNAVSNVTEEEGIDAVYLRHTLIAHNDVSNITGNGGIVVKAASDGVKIHNNHVQDITGNGISVGGHSTGQGASWPNGVAYEARNIDVKGNLVEDVSKHAIITYAAHDSTISKNSFQPNNSYYAVAATAKDNHGWDSKNIQFTDNIVQRDKWLADHSQAVTVDVGNVKIGSFSEKVGSGVLGAAAQASDGQWKEGGNIQETIKGTAKPDTLKGTDKNDYIDGGRSHDTMIGGKGDDVYTVGSSYDKVVEKAGEGVDAVRAWLDSYTLPDNVENLFGMKSTGMGLTGNNLSNIIKGRAGNDTLSGGGGADQLWGGDGRDSFVFKSLSDKGDVIMDFKMGQDTVDLRPLLSSNQDLDVEVVAKGFNAVAVWVHHDDSVEELVTLMGVNSSELSAMQPGKAAWLLI